MTLRLPNEMFNISDSNPRPTELVNGGFCLEIYVPGGVIEATSITFNDDETTTFEGVYRAYGVAVVAES